MSKEARDFAISAHGGQLYGSEPYRSHLFSVVQILRDYGFRGKWEEAGWLHDTIEDTQITLEDLRGRFGDWVAQVVWAVSGVGHNRKTRNASIYSKLANNHDSRIVKVADRIANVENSKAGSSHRAMYLKERDEFEAAAREGVPGLMWERLERAYMA